MASVAVAQIYLYFRSNKERNLRNLFVVSSLIRTFVSSKKMYCPAHSA